MKYKNYRKKKNQFSSTKRVIPSAVKKYVKSMVTRNVESKYTDNYTSSTAITQTFTYLRLSTTSVGTNNYSRIGNIINATSLHIKGRIANQITTPVTVRVLVFKWMVNDLVDLPQSSELFQDPTSGFRMINSPINMDLRNRAVILSDKRYCLDPIKSTEQLINEKFYFKPKAGKIQLGASAVSPDDGIGHYYIAYFADATSAGLQHDFNYSTRLVFKDA